MTLKIFNECKSWLVISYVSMMGLKIMKWIVFHLFQCGEFIGAICFG